MAPEATTALLFTPANLRGCQLENRVVVSPMAQYSAIDGKATDWHMMHLGSMAVSGAGLVITEFAAVSPEGRISTSDLGIWSDETADALRRIVDFTHANGHAKFGIQLSHAGRKGAVSKYWEGHRPLTRAEGGWTLLAPSPEPYPGRYAPSALDREGVQKVLDDFAAAAVRAEAIGADLLEIHAAHGYLLHTFLSPLSNHRQDEYGGSPENRMRFPLEVFRRVREAWSVNKPIGVRISSTDWTDGGWTLADSIEFCRRLKAEGCDYITASGGGLLPQQKIKVYPGYQVEYAREIRKQAGIATIAVGLITTARQAEDILEAGSADFIALGHAMLANPRWPLDAAIELEAACSYPPQYERAHMGLRGKDFLHNPRSAKPSA